MENLSFQIFKAKIMGAAAGEALGLRRKLDLKPLEMPFSANTSVSYFSCGSSFS